MGQESFKAVGYGLDTETALRALNAYLKFHYDVSLDKEDDTGYYYLELKDGTKRYVHQRRQNSITKCFFGE